MYCVYSLRKYLFDDYMYLFVLSFKFEIFFFFIKVLRKSLILKESRQRVYLVKEYCSFELILFY